ncbi:hypothetical protein [Acidisphaera sp. L21]|uniref:hypothetical protein n=1 Tax=Acidisphaera sp. L21 TaxID=1641851 RepID=UPI0020B16562|nr:hypothetical protein [Acidisphaera sp. L21]
MIARDLPTFMVWQTAVGQGGLAPSAIQESHSSIFVGKISRCCFNLFTVEVGL